jgi:hypothetical protein
MVIDLYGIAKRPDGKGRGLMTTTRNASLQHHAHLKIFASARNIMRGGKADSRTLDQSPLSLSIHAVIWGMPIAPSGGFV